MKTMFVLFELDMELEDLVQVVTSEDLDALKQFAIAELESAMDDDFCMVQELVWNKVEGTENDWYLNWEYDESYRGSGQYTKHIRAVQHI